MDCYAACVESPQSIRLRSRNVILGGSDGPLRVCPADVVIEDGTIAGVSEPDPSATEVIDVGADLIAPAFINAHTHLSMGAFRGLLGPDDLAGNVVEDLFFRLESGLQADDVRAFTRLGAYECLAAGVGMVWDHYYFGTSVAAGIIDAGLCGVVAPTLQDLSGPGLDQLEQQLEATTELTGDSYAAQGIFSALGPHATDTVSPELWRKLGDLADRHQLPVHAHVAQSVEEFERAQERHQTTPLGMLERTGLLARAPSLLAVHGIFLTDEDLTRLDPKRHALGYCPLSQQQFCFPAHVPSWTQAGLPFVVGTDCSVSNDAMNVQRELVAVAGIRGFGPASSHAYTDFRQLGTTDAARAADRVRVEHLEKAGHFQDPQTLLRTVWSTPGSLHPGMKVGSIAAGHLANLIVLDIDHPNLWPASDLLRGMALCDAAPAIHSMMLRGRWVTPRGRHRDALNDDVRAAAADAKDRLKHHLARIGWS